LPKEDDFIFYVMAWMDADLFKKNKYLKELFGDLGSARMAPEVVYQKPQRQYYAEKTQGRKRHFEFASAPEPLGPQHAEARASPNLSHGSSSTW
jgi:hypothetical protein